MEHTRESDGKGGMKSRANTPAFFPRFSVKVHA